VPARTEVTIGPNTPIRAYAAFHKAAPYRRVLTHSSVR
jgi:hypothetical protein